MPNDYENLAHSIVRAASGLENEIFRDLDIDRGGTGWMHGAIDVRRNCLITDYLIASVRGVGMAATGAAHSLEQYRAARTSSDYAFRQRLRAARDAGQNDTAALAARTPADREKEVRVDLEVEHIVMHLGQLLDRLAACIVGVAGLPNDILTISWSTISKRARNGLPMDRSLRGSQAESGYERQALLIRGIGSRIDGQPDALEWLWRLRHTTLHRSPMMNWIIQSQTGRTTYKLVAAFPRQPDWALHEAMAAGKHKNMTDLLLLKDPTDILDGLWAVVRDLAESTLDDLSQLWAERREQPALIVQPGGQWARIGERETFEFDGFGDDLKILKGAVHVAPREAERIQAAKILDTDSSIWNDEA